MTKHLQQFNKCFLGLSFLVLVAGCTENDLVSPEIQKNKEVGTVIKDDCPGTELFKIQDNLLKIQAEYMVELKNTVGEERAGVIKQLQSLRDKITINNKRLQPYTKQNCNDYRQK
jgi:hypothetical protein